MLFAVPCPVQIRYLLLFLEKKMSAHSNDGIVKSEARCALINGELGKHGHGPSESICIIDALVGRRTLREHPHRRAYLTQEAKRPVRELGGESAFCRFRCAGLFKCGAQRDTGEHSADCLGRDALRLLHRGEANRL